jgi:hypothetical protein
VAFHPDFFMEYVKDSYDIHSTGNLNKYLYEKNEEHPE